IDEAAAAIRESRTPVIVAGGGVIYSEATDALASFCEATGIPVAETQAGRGSLDSSHELSLGAVGATGTLAANRIAREADLVIGIGTRYSDFTTASNTAFENPLVRFVNLNVTGLDAFKRSAVPVLGDARESLESLRQAVGEHRVTDEWADRIRDERTEWIAISDEIRADGEGTPLKQAAVIAAVNDAAGDDGIVVCAAGSMPGDLHKLWRATHPKAYHVEYGYSCMGYEIPGAMGVKLAAPDRPVFAMVGDGSWLMLPGELVTAVSEGIGIVIVLLDNHGYASIGALSRSLGQSGFGTHYRTRPSREQVVDSGSGDRPAGDSGPLPVDLATNAESLGAVVIRVSDMAALRDALEASRDTDHPVVIHAHTDRYQGVPDFESWWDVPPAEVARDRAVTEARAAYDERRLKQRLHLEGK
ncbi:MAG: thiamine pyrophosphate-dependent enzyme, partial [Actinomycetota bacterium]|nr:thiamine pyrophosphate-dependent enzyme [Actinomycetota bacterium]